MSLKWFDPRPKIKNTTVSFAKNFVTIDRRGKEYLDNPQYLTIGYDDETLEVKIQAVEDSNPYKLEVFPNRDNIRISVPEFIAETGIKGKFIGNLNEKKGIITIEIPKKYFSNKTDDEDNEE